MDVLPAYVPVNHVSGVCRGQKKVLDPLELVLQVVVSIQLWVLGLELQSSGRTDSAVVSRPSLQPLAVSFDSSTFPVI